MKKELFVGYWDFQYLMDRIKRSKSKAYTIAYLYNRLVEADFPDTDHLKRTLVLLSRCPFLETKVSEKTNAEKK